MKREYQIILISYIVMLLLLQTGSNLVYSLLQQFGLDSSSVLKVTAISIWYTVSFLSVLVLSIYLLKKEFRSFNHNALSWTASIAWAVIGVFLALIAQRMAIMIETFIGIDPGSQNTESILSLIERAPIIVLITSIIGPILEEIIFRKIVFGTLNKKYHFFLAASISSLLFSIAHGEIEHILLYFAIGFTFAFLYVKTERIIVPILTHVLMNSYVLIAAFFL